MHSLSHFVLTTEQAQQTNLTVYVYYPLNSYRFYNQLSLYIRLLFHITFPKTLVAVVCYSAVVHS